MKTGTAVVLGLAGAGVAYMFLKPKTAEASDAGTTPEPVAVDVPTANGQPTIAKRKGNLKVVLKLRVSGAEKMFANTDHILRDVLKGAKAVAANLPTACPGAPKLMGAPSGTIGGTSDGYAVQLVFPALWGGSKTGPVKETVRDCLIKEIRKNKKVNERFISLTANRISANA
jgi:hypothetical protein